jgi:hypothetical protein
MVFGQRRHSGSPLNLGLAGSDKGDAAEGGQDRRRYKQAEKPPLVLSDCH